MNRILLSALLVACLVSVGLGADDGAKGLTNEVKAQLAKKIPGAKPEDVRPSPISGMYEISLGTSTGYISADGKYLISGDLYEVETKTNLTEERRTVVRERAVAAIKDSDTIVFGPTNPPKHTITVFIDVD